MLRASHDVLAPGGLIGGFTIHTPTGLSAADETLAVDLGPSQVLATGSPPELARKVGFVDVQTVDLTQTFLETCKAILKSRSELETNLRAEEGDEAYEEEQVKKSNMAKGIELGLLRRSLIMASKQP